MNIKETNIEISLDNDEVSVPLITNWIKSVNIPLYQDMSENIPMFYMANKETPMSVVEVTGQSEVVFNTILDRWDIPKLYDSKDIVEDVPNDFFVSPEAVATKNENVILCKTHTPQTIELHDYAVSILQTDNPGIMYNYLVEYFSSDNITIENSIDTGHFSYVYRNEELLAVFYKRTTGRLGYNSGIDVANIAELMVLLLPDSTDRDDFTTFIYNKVNEWIQSLYKMIEDFVVTTKDQKVYEYEILEEDRLEALMTKHREISLEKEKINKEIIKLNSNQVINIENKKLLQPGVYLNELNEKIESNKSTLIVKRKELETIDEELDSILIEISKDDSDE